MVKSKIIEILAFKLNMMRTIDYTPKYLEDFIDIRNYRILKVSRTCNKKTWSKQCNNFTSNTNRTGFMSNIPSHSDIQTQLGSLCVISWIHLTKLWLEAISFGRLSPMNFVCIRRLTDKKRFPFKYSLFLVASVCP